MIRMPSARSGLPHAPNIMAPRHSGETCTPVLPRMRISMAWHCARCRVRGMARLGVSVVPAADAFEEIRAFVRAADAAGLAHIGIQDHPYQRRFLDTWALMAWLLADT